MNVQRLTQRIVWERSGFLAVVGVLLAVGAALVVLAQTVPDSPGQRTGDDPGVWPSATPGPHAVGFRVLQEYDSTRTFKPKYDYFGNPTEGPIARPLQMCVWYPAAVSDNSKHMRLEEYYQLEATVTDFVPPTSDRLKWTVERFKQAWPIEFRVPPEKREEIRSRIEQALQEEVYAVRNADPAHGPFPLIVHMPGYNGGPDGSSYLFEYLASHGYVIAAVANMGEYRRTIDDEAASLDVQARDLEFAAARLRTLPFVDPTRTGASGMSWGGMSNVLFAERNFEVDAVLTLDGAITMPEELKLIEAVPGYSHKNLRAAYMQLLVTPEEAKFRPKDLRFYDSLEYGDACMVQFRGVDHDEFACGYLRLRNLNEADPDRLAYLERFSREVYSCALTFFDAYLKKDTSALRSLTAWADHSARTDAADTMIALRDFKKGKPRPLSRGEFVDIIKAKGAEEALNIYRDYCRIQPRNNLIVSEAIGPLYMDAFECGNLTEALAICELWETGLPRNPGPLFSKGRIYTKMGDTAGAINCYERIQEIATDTAHIATARRRIKELRSAPLTSDPIGIRWLGQASFLLATSKGTTIITDPIKFKGYAPPVGTTADIVTVSHEHIDHNSIDAISGSPAVFHGTDSKCRHVTAVDTTVADVRLYSVPSFHDPGHRGSNAIFVFEFDGIRVAHLGDIGETLTREQIAAIGAVDILMIPVGGQFTIAAAEADTIVNQLNVSRYVLPMHYKTEAFDDLPYTAEPFLKGKNHVRRIEDNNFTFDPSIPVANREYIVMRY